MKPSARWALALLTGVCLAVAMPAIRAQQGAPAAKATTAKSQAVKALRDTPVEAAEQGGEGESFKAERDHPSLPRDFVQQPPLIPHTIRGYDITMNFNKCMDCHSWSRARETGATKVSLTHFRDRDGKELPNVSPRRYFCMQCHVPQTEAKPLVSNTFRPASGLK